ncbi:MAG: EAL domain-containing protein [Nocardioidaceae bacterium]
MASRLLSTTSAPAIPRLSYLKRFTIDVVKLDRTFVEGLVTDPVDAEIASAVIKLTKALDINTIAEGVETESQRRMLVEMGCPLVQGFLTAPALTAPDFLELWRRSHERATSAQPPRALRPDGLPTDRAVLPQRRRLDPE